MPRELYSRLFPLALVCLLLSFGCSDRSTDAPASLTVSGTVVDPVTLNGIPGATVSVIDAEKGDLLSQIVTGQNGAFKVDQLPKVRLYVLVEADGYQVTDQSIYDPAHTEIKPTGVSILMKTQKGEPCCTGLLTVTAKDQAGNPVSGATVSVWKSGKLLKSAVTVADGKANIGDLCAGEYAVNVTKSGLAEKEFKFGINTNCEPVAKTVEMAPGPCCSGVYSLTVVDGSGNPIAGAAVKIRKAGNVVAQLTTDAQGKIVAGNLCGGEYVVNITKDNYTAKELKFSINENCDPVSQTAALEPGPCCTGKLTAIVRDKNGNPVNDANVKIQKAGVVVASVMTDANGKAVIENLCGGDYSGWVIKSGFNTKEFTFTIGVDCAPVSKEFVLEGSPCCTGTFTLTVKDKNGAPIAGATVKIYKNGAVYRTETTNADGKVTVVDLCAGSYGVDVTRDGYTHKEMQFVINENCDPVTSDIVLEKSACCSGIFTLTVRDASGNPIAGATVTASKAGAVVRTGTTNADGKVSFDGLCAGDYSFRVTKDNYKVKEGTFTIDVNCTPVTREVSLEGSICCSGTFTLTVKDKNGNPIVGATVKIYKNGAVYRTETTNADGKITVVNLCAGDYGVDVTKDGYTHKELTFSINTNCDPVTKDVVLESGPCCSGVLTLTVRNAAGSPVAGATVNVMKAGAVVKSGTTGADGKVSFDGLCAGDYTFKVTKDGFLAKEGAFSINSNCEPVSKEVTLETGPCCSGVFTLTVKDKNGAAVVGAAVKLMKNGAVLKSGTTNADGKATFDGLCAGDYAVLVTKDGYASKDMAFTINANCDPVTKDMTLESVCCSGTFTLTVKDKNGAPIVGAKVQILKAGAVLRTETTNGEGKITAVNLCAGEYTVKVTKDGYNAGTLSFTIDANCDPVTRDITLEPTPCCSGVLTVTVTDSNNNPLAGATVKLYKAGILLKTITTDQLGKAIFDSLCKADYGVDVSKEGYNHQEFSFGINASCDPVTKTVALTQ